MIVKYNNEFNALPQPPQEPWPAFKKAWKAFESAPWTIGKTEKGELFIIDRRYENRSMVILPPEMIDNLLTFLDVEKEQLDK